MSIRTIEAPGIQINEIDKSQYSPAMTGTRCYIMGFANKGEPYVPMQFTSRAALQSYYGEPDTEAEKYFYNACMEVINQNGVLYTARLPYDNDAKDNYVGFTYQITNSGDPVSNASALISSDGAFHEIYKVDPSIKDAYFIDSKDNVITFSNKDVMEWVAGEKKVPSNNFRIIDKTCASYNRIMEDSEHKNRQREVLGIFPVVTTAANAMYAQSLIQVDNHNVYNYETVGDLKTQFYQDLSNIISGNAKYGSLVDYNDGTWIYNEDGSLSVQGTSRNNLLAKQLNTSFKNYKWRCEKVAPEINTIKNIPERLEQILSADDTVFGMTIQTLSGLSSQLWTTLDNDVSATNSIISAISSVHGVPVFDKVVLSTDTVGEFVTKVKNLIDHVYSDWIPADNDDSVPETVSRDANSFFSPITFDVNANNGAGGFDRTNLKKIGVVVFKAFMDPEEGNKINFEPLESFVGSLCSDDKDPNTGMSTFLDDIVNTNSNYIYFFSNCFVTKTSKKKYQEEADIILPKPLDNCGMLGFYWDQVNEDISLKTSIYDGMNKCFDKVSDINERDIDIVCDAGIANIASYIQAVFGTGKGEFDLKAVDENQEPPLPLISKWKVNDSTAAVKTWKTVEQKYDTFCKSVRKDCMFIADSLRPLSIQGEKKVVRPTKPDSNIDVDILPYIKYQTGLNTNYGAGYLNWYQITDEFTGDFMWCPPSIKAMGVYINTDLNFNYWDAPAGLNRGIVPALDLSFSPTEKQAGPMYNQSWNYAVNYPQDGIAIMGQKTFQVKPTALDRVNVRRLFLRLERQTGKILKYILFEGNTAYTRQRVVDLLDPMFKEAKIGGGIYDYKIICDESNNPPETIDRNELHVSIGIKPVRSIEFIMVDFICTSTGASWDEVM